MKEPRSIFVFALITANACTTHPSSITALLLTTAFGCTRVIDFFSLSIFSFVLLDYR